MYSLVQGLCRVSKLLNPRQIASSQLRTELPSQVLMLYCDLHQGDGADVRDATAVHARNHASKKTITSRRAIRKSELPLGLEPDSIAGNLRVHCAREVSGSSRK